MSKERFQYLLQSYKLNRLSEDEGREWQCVVGEEKYKGVIKSDIEIALRSILFERARMEAVLDDIWRRILAVSAGVKSPGSAG